MKKKDHKIAIIDLGSNSVRLIIFAIYSGKYYKLMEQEKEMVRLSEDLSSDGYLKEAPINRTLLTLSLFKDLIHSHDVEKVILAATAAVRNAHNQSEFLQKIKEEFNWNFEVISGEREAWLGFLGVVNTISLDDYYLIDIGGASTEISYIRNRTLKEAISLDVGAVTFKDKEKDFYKALGDLEWLKERADTPLIGLGGTLRSFAKIFSRNSGYPIDKLHNLELPFESAEKTIKTVFSKSPDHLHKINGLDKSRIDIIVPGLTILHSVMKTIRPEKVVISGNGLREGLLYEYLLQDKKTPVYTDVRRHSIKNLLYNYDMDKDHAAHITCLSERLFSSTKKLHNISPDYLYLLLNAAMLHDIGIYIDYYLHHRHSYYLIMNSSLYGFTHRETLMIALICARHRNKSFKITYTDYKDLLTKDDLFIINLFSLFLRIAENLDRNEEANIRDIEAKDSNGTVTLFVLSKKNVSLEISAAMKSALDFKKLLGKELVITQKKAEG